MKPALTPLLLALLLTGCEGEPSRDYQGALYFGQGAYLMRFSLVDGSLTISGHFGDTTIHQVTALGEDHLLVAEYASVNRRRVPRISWINLRTGETADLYAGVGAAHLADARVVVYDDGSELYAVPQQFDGDNEVIFSHPEQPLSRLMEASPGILLVETGDGEERVIHGWDARNGELRNLVGLTAACRLVGAVWIGSRERLACKQRSGALADAEYVMSDLDGKVEGRLDLPEGKDFFALTHIEHQDSLVLQETWRGLLGDRDRHAVWMHDLETGETHRLAENVNLGGSVVYADY